MGELREKVLSVLEIGHNDLKCKRLGRSENREPKNRRNSESTGFR